MAALLMVSIAIGVVVFITEWFWLFSSNILIWFVMLGLSFVPVHDGEF